MSEGSKSESEGNTTLVSRKTIVAAVVLIATVVGAFLFFRSRSDAEVRAPLPRKITAIQALPANAFLAGTLDVERIRKLGLLSPGGPMAELNTVRTACGFDPLDTISEIGFIIPHEGDGDFGLAAVGTVDTDAIVSCATKVISSRAGRPVTTTLGSFRSVRDGATGAPPGELAVRAFGPILIGDGKLLRSLVDTADGAIPSLETEGVHKDTRSLLEGMELFRVSAVLSDAQRKTIMEESGEASETVRRALESVKAGGAGIRVEGEMVEFHAVVITGGAEHASALAELLSRRLRDEATSPMLKVFGADDLVAKVRVEAASFHVHLRLTAKLTEVRGVIDRLVAFRALTQGGAGRSPSPVPSALPSGSTATP
jgi:hypothetical protein